MSTWEIKMLSDVRGSDNGFSVRQYKDGELYVVGTDIGDTLARRFIGLGYATESTGEIQHGL